MGNSERTIVSTMVQNTINMKIKNATTNIMRQINEYNTSITTSMVATASAEAAINVDVRNEASLGKIVMNDDTTFDVTQNAEAQAQTTAVMKIVSEQSALNELSSKLATQIMNSLANKTDASADLKTLAATNKSTSDGGGPEGMLKSITGALEKIGSSGQNITETIVENVINQTIENTTINENEIRTKIDSTLNTSMTLEGLASCKLNTIGGNKLTIDEIEAGGKAKFKLTQALNIKSATNCFQDLNLGAKIATSLAADQYTGVISETSNENRAGASSTAEASTTDKNESKSGIMGFLNNLVDTIGNVIGGGQLMIVAIVIGIVIVLVVGVVMIMPSSGGSSERGPPMRGPPMRGPPMRGPPMRGPPMRGPPSSDDEQDGGGVFDPCNLYLYGALFTTFLFVYSKSITICGVMLALFIGFVIYSMNKNNNLN